MFLGASISHKVDIMGLWAELKSYITVLFRSVITFLVIPVSNTFGLPGADY